MAWLFRGEIIFKKNQKVIIKNELVNLTLGRVDFIDKQPVVIAAKNLNLDTFSTKLPIKKIYNWNKYTMWNFTCK